MPIRCFWTLLGNINRIQAQDDLRSLSIACYSQDNKASQTYRETLIVEIGQVYEYQKIPNQDKLDREGLKALKALINKK